LNVSASFESGCIVCCPHPEFRSLINPLQGILTVKKLFYVLIAAIVTPLLGGCFETGSAAAAPPWVNTGAPLFNSPNNGATAGDGRVKLEWIPTAGVEYWAFSATNPSLTAFNWTGLPNALAVIAALTPSYMCGLIDNSAYYFATNGRINGGPGGPSSSTISATPYNASANSWTPNTSLIQDIYGLGYTSLTTCANNTALSATGTFAAVGAGGTIFTSPDAISWTGQSSPVATNLNAVAGYAAYQNNATTSGLRWVAVGNGGTAVYSTDGINWTAATAIATATTQNLRSIIQVGGGFYAVGDAGTIISSNDGNTWAAGVSNTSNRLNGIAHAGMFVAVGDNGTIVVNGGSGWVAQTSNTASNLRQVAAITTIYGSIYVAVGDGDTIVTSDSYTRNGSWTTLTLPGALAPNLVGVTVEPRGVETTTAYTIAPAVDPWLKFISAAQFVAMDSAGNTYTSVNGHDWTATGNNTGITCTLGTTCLNPLINSGFGYVAAGNAGATAYAF
jgi:hypothetical protein